jgi:hypothetical protein
MKTDFGMPTATGVTGQRRRVCATVVAVSAALMIAALAVSAAAQARPGARFARLNHRCSTFKGPDIYGQPHQPTERYGVYVTRGRVTCATAIHIVRGDINGKGVVHNGNPPLGDYRSYDGWVCPGGNMGYEFCQRQSRPVANPRTEIVSVACKIADPRGCPTKLPFS